MGDFSTDAILLRRLEYGDHDIIATFLTRDKGKLSVMAKNARKSVRRFPGSLDLFTLYHIQCTAGRKRRDSLMILDRSDMQNGFVTIRYNMLKTAYASYWVEMTGLWLEEGLAQPGIFELLLLCLDRMDRSDGNPDVLSLMFQLRFMAASGFSPGFQACDTCRTPVEQLGDSKICFDVTQGKIRCHRCGGCNGSRHGIPVSKGTLRQLHWMQTADILRTERMRFSGQAIREGRDLMESFVPFHIGREFKTLKFIRRLRQESWI